MMPLPVVQEAVTHCVCGALRTHGRPDKWLMCGLCGRRAIKVAEPPPVEGARWLQLGRGRHFSLVDEADYHGLMQRRWYWNETSGHAYCWAAVHGQCPLQMHRVLLQIEDPTIIIDHVNGNRLDNRRSNLRVATPAQNTWNAKARSTNKSSYKGVWQRSDTGAYTAQITAHGKTLCLGTFQTAEAAAVAYNAAAIKVHGEFARLNEIEVES